MGMEGNGASVSPSLKWAVSSITSGYVSALTQGPLQFSLSFCLKGKIKEAG